MPVAELDGIEIAYELVGKGHPWVLTPGGIIANVGVHGTKVDLHLERLWSENIAITTRLVDTVTTPMLLKTVQSKKIDPKLLITHRFKLDKDLWTRSQHRSFEGDHRSLGAARARH